MACCRRRFARQQLRTWRLFPDTSLGVPPGGLIAFDLAVFPNPAGRAGAAHLAFRLPASAPTRLSVHDLRGARVASVDYGVLGAGSHLLEWSPGALRPGVYFLRVDAGGLSATRRIAVVQ